MLLQVFWAIVMVLFSVIFVANANSEYSSNFYVSNDDIDDAYVPSLSSQLPLKRTTRQVYRRPAPFIAGATVGRLTSPYRYAAIANSPSYYYPSYYSPYYYGR